MKKLLIVIIVISIPTYSLYSQSKTIRGRVISDQFDILIGVPIMIEDTVVVGKTDINGYFQIDVPVPVKKILLMDVGLEPITIELVDKCDKIEVVMMLSSSNDFMTLKRVDRKMKKRYKKLPEIHKQAFEKGLFERDTACYKRKNEPLYLNE